jgi:hypothetical protein
VPAPASIADAAGAGADVSVPTSHHDSLVVRGGGCRGAWKAKKDTPMSHEDSLVVSLA